jgi:hypothetical protein
LSSLEHSEQLGFDYIIGMGEDIYEAMCTAAVTLPALLATAQHCFSYVKSAVKSLMVRS